MAQTLWDAVKFPGSSDGAAIDSALHKLTSARKRMYKAGKFRNDPESIKKEVTDLRNKVPKGSVLYYHLY